MDNLFQLIRPHFLSNQALPHLEVEFRLGKINGKHFDTNVGEFTFNKIFDSLKNFNGWENVIKSETTSYFVGNRRMDINEETQEMKSFIKKRITKIDNVIPGQPLDVRFSTAQENPIDDLDCEEEMDFMRCKERTSFIRKNLSIDMTIVTAEPDDPDDESEHFYEIELEILDPSKVNSDKLLYNIIFKIQSILNIL
jgi:hypothetical protein